MSESDNGNGSSGESVPESKRTYVLSKFQLLGDWLKQGVVKEENFEKPIHYDTKLAFFQLKMPGAQLLTIPIVITARELASIRIAALSVESMQNHTIEFMTAKFAQTLMTLTEALEQLEKGQVSE